MDMKILYFFKNLPSMMFQWQKFHIIDELKIHGCDVEIFDPHQYENLEKANQAVLRKIREGHYDMFMTCHNENIVFTETIREIKKTGIPTVLFCPDNLVIPFYHKKCAIYYDLVWLTSIETKYLFDKWGCNSVFLPYAANPYFLKPMLDEEEIERVGFIGTPHGSRVFRLRMLAYEGIPISIHTKKSNFNQDLLLEPSTTYLKAILQDIRFPIGRKLAYASFIDKLLYRKINLDCEAIEIHEPVPLQSLGKMNGKYALMLSFTEANSTAVLKHPVPIVNLRNFEIPMSGGLQFTMYSAEIADYFEDEKEIILAHSIEEYIDKAKFYLKSEQASLRKRMKFAARRRAEMQHTWYNRFLRIFQVLGLVNKRSSAVSLYI